MPIAVLTTNRFPAIAAAFPGAASQVVRKTTFDIQAGAQNLVPVDTGALKNSIGAEVDGTEGVVFTNMVYAPRIEFGFVGADSRGRVYNQAPQPYMTPAAEAARPGFIDALSHLERLL